MIPSLPRRLLTGSTNEVQNRYSNTPRFWNGPAQNEHFARQRGGASVLVNGAVFKTVSEPARAGLGRFDSYTPPPNVSRQPGRQENRKLNTAQV